METELIQLDPGNIDEAALRRAGRIIREGGLVAFPTETVYGLGGDALNPDAARRIYAAKGRPSDNPLIVHMAEWDKLPHIAAEIPDAAFKAAEAFWPGPLTMILKKKACVPDATSGGLPTVAVRMPSDPVAQGLIRASTGYIAAPSANASGRPSPTSAAHVMEDLGGRIEMILDGGDVEIGLESTIIDLTEGIPVILRPGFITRDMLEEVLGEVRIDPGILDGADLKGVRPKAPGMRYRHYAPKAPLCVVEGERESVLSKICALAGAEAAGGRRCGILCAADSAGRYEAELGDAAMIVSLGLRDRDYTIARKLYASLRGFDEEGVSAIFSEAFDTPVLGMAIMNRLLKAAGHQVIEV